MERSREGVSEAVHFGSAVAVSASADFLFHAGAPTRIVLPRSAAKLLLALPYILSGAADGQADARIALAAASHGAEVLHLEALENWAQTLGMPPSKLECGPDLPLSRAKLAGATGTPSVFHNNNAGKHLGVLASVLYLGEEIAGYCDAGHPAQLRLMDSLCEYCDMPAPAETLLDNCGMRTMALPLSKLAFGMARLASDARFPGPCARLLDAIARAPVFLSGSRRLVTGIIEVTQGRVIAKGGSEGIFAALDRQRLVGHALKIEDGSSEAASAAIIEWLAATGALKPDESAILRKQTQFWQHPFAPERSPIIRFPFVEQIRA